MRDRYPHLKGRSLKAVMLNPSQDGPRGSVNVPGDGALYCWDGLNMLDPVGAYSATSWSLSSLSDARALAISRSRLR